MQYLNCTYICMKKRYRNGHSTVFDGVAWFRDEPGVRDMCILEAPDEEGIYLAEIDMDMLQEYRAMR